jgi:hypothetical protein
MDLSAVAADYVRAHRGDCTDEQIRKALKDQGFSDGVLDDAFHAAGPREAEPNPGLMLLVRLMYGASALLLLGALALFAYNLTHGAR